MVRTMKGQMSAINFAALFVVELMFLSLLPVLLTFIQSTVVTIQAGTPNEFTQWLIVIIEMLPFAIQIMIILTGIWIAMPHSQQGG